MLWGVHLWWVPPCRRTLHDDTVPSQSEACVWFTRSRERHSICDREHENPFYSLRYKVYKAVLVARNPIDADDD